MLLQNFKKHKTGIGALLNDRLGKGNWLLEALEIKPKRQVLQIHLLLWSPTPIKDRYTDPYRNICRLLGHNLTVEDLKSGPKMFQIFDDLCKELIGESV